MIGMTFISFLALLIVGLVAASVLHFALRYRMMQGLDGFAAKWILGWVGAWLGSPVLGHWWFAIQNVYIVPALVGAFVAGFSGTFLLKVLTVVNGGMARSTTSAATGPEVLRKAS